jgi:hypothetical protein
MNADRSDFDRTLRTWFEEGPTVMADRMVDVIADRIARQPQRRTWRLRGRPSVNTYVKLAAALAAVIVVAVVGYNLLPGTSEPGGNATTAPTPTIQPSAAASEGATCTGVVDAPEFDSALEACRYRLRPSDTYAVEADIPDGWSKFGTLLEVVGPGANGPSGVGVAFQAIESGLYSDACHWDLAGTGELEPGDVEVGPEVQDLVDALRANDSYTATTPSSVTFGPYQGKRLEIQIPTDLDLDTCDAHVSDGDPRYQVAPGTLYAQGQGNRWDMSIVDVDGTRVIVTIIYYEGTPAADLEAARAIVDSLEFTP